MTVRVSHLLWLYHSHGKVFPSEDPLVQRCLGAPNSAALSFICFCKSCTAFWQLRQDVADQYCGYIHVNLEFMMARLLLATPESQNGIVANDKKGEIKG